MNYNIKDCIFNIGEAWDSVKDSILINTWKILIDPAPDREEIMNEILEEETTAIKELSETLFRIKALSCNSEEDVVDWMDNDDLLMMESIDDHLDQLEKAIRESESESDVEIISVGSANQIRVPSS